MTKKLIIGIIPQIKRDDIDYYQEKYEFINLYSKRIYEAGAIPIGLTLNDFEVSLEQLELCDAYLYPGGSRVDKGLYKIFYYAYINKKPILGICLGMQAMCIFSTMLEEFRNNNLSLNNVTNDKFKELYNNMAQSNPVLVKIENEEQKHLHDNYVTKEKYEHSLYPINIEEGSFLYKIYGNNKNVMHLHGVEAKRIGCLLKCVAKSEDNVLEAVESIDNNLNWLGVQFHPEFEDDNPLIKKWLKNIK